MAFERLSDPLLTIRPGSSSRYLTVAWWRRDNVGESNRHRLAATRSRRPRIDLDAFASAK